MADFGICTMGHPFIYRQAQNKSKRRTNWRRRQKEGLDVMQFIAGETPTQPISLVCSWLKTTLELIPLTCSHNHALSTGPHQQAWSDELVHHVHKIQVHFNIVHHYAVRIIGDALKVRWKINKHMLFIFIQILIEGGGEWRGGDCSKREQGERGHPPYISD